MSSTHTVSEEGDNGNYPLATYLKMRVFLRNDVGGPRSIPRSRIPPWMCHVKHAIPAYVRGSGWTREDDSCRTVRKIVPAWQIARGMREVCKNSPADRSGMQWSRPLGVARRQRHRQAPNDTTSTYQQRVEREIWQLHQRRESGTVSHSPPQHIDSWLAMTWQRHVRHVVNPDQRRLGALDSLH